MAVEELTIGIGTTLSVVSHSEELLELRASYEGRGAPPPAHLHPAQDERFEILAGSMTAKIAGREHELGVGDVLEVPHSTVHQMWNPGEERAVVSWKTMPAGRTLEWFREIAAVQHGEPLSDPATLLARYGDVYRLADA